MFSVLDIGLSAMVEEKHDLQCCKLKQIKHQDQHWKHLVSLDENCNIVLWSDTISLYMLLL
jgi:hypothetical protein